jgi:hypothetical protein
MSPRLTYPPRACASCGRVMELTINGTFRRHFRQVAGRRLLCPSTGKSALTPAESAQSEPKVVPGYWESRRLRLRPR